MARYFFEARLEVGLEQVVDLLYFGVVDHVFEVLVRHLHLVLVLVGEEVLEFKALVGDEFLKFLGQLLLVGQQFWVQFFLLDCVDVAVDGLEVPVVVLLADLPHQFNYKFADKTNPPQSWLATIFIMKPGVTENSVHSIAALKKKWEDHAGKRKRGIRLQQDQQEPSERFETQVKEEQEICDRAVQSLKEGAAIVIDWTTRSNFRVR